MDAQALFLRWLMQVHKQTAQQMAEEDAALRPTPAAQRVMGPPGLAARGQGAQTAMTVLGPRQRLSAAKGAASSQMLTGPGHVVRIWRA